MVAPCENSLRLTGRVMDAKSSLDHCAIPAEPPSLRFPRPAKRWTGDRWKAAQVCPLPEPARCPSLPVARACRGLRQAQPPKTYAAQACPLPEPTFCPSLPVARACRGLRQAQPPKTYAAQACPLPEPTFCPSLPVARACRGLRQAQPPKIRAAQACPLPEPVEGFGKLSHRKLTLPKFARCPSLPVARARRGLRQAQPPKTYAARACVSAAPRFSGAGIEGSGFGTCMQNMQCRQDQPTEGDVNESL